MELTESDHKEIEKIAKTASAFLALLEEQQKLIEFVNQKYRDSSFEENLS